MDAADLRAQFPVLRRCTYLNAGTDGPLPGAAARASTAELLRQTDEGRWTAHLTRRTELSLELRERYAARLGCEGTDLALTTSTSEGMSTVISGMDLGPGDEILTGDEEHPGLLGPLIAARDGRGVTIRTAPFAELAGAVGPATRLVACSHVSWVSGALAPPGLAEVDVPLLLDGAQGVGAVPVDVGRLRCAAYAGAGQKWLCGPDGLGMLHVAPEFRERLAATRPAYANLADPGAGLNSPVHADARRYDSPALSAEAIAVALAGLDVLEQAGWPALYERSAHLAEMLAERLTTAGWDVLPRHRTTLVTWRATDAAARRDALADQGIVIRALPGGDLLRASVGAWNADEDLDRLLGALGTPG